MDSLPFDMLFEIYKYLNLKEKIMMSKNFKCFKDVLKQNIINKIINVGLIKIPGEYTAYIRIIYSSIKYNENSIIYPFFVDDETIDKINNCIYLEEQKNLIKSILLNGIVVDDDSCFFFQMEQDLDKLELTFENYKKNISEFYLHDIAPSEEYEVNFYRCFYI